MRENFSYLYLILAIIERNLTEYVEKNPYKSILDLLIVFTFKFITVCYIYIFHESLFDEKRHAFCCQKRLYSIRTLLQWISVRL